MTQPIRMGAFALGMLVLGAAAHADVLVTWDFTQDAQGWSGTNILNQTQTPEGVQFDTDGNDPQWTSPATSWNGDTDTIRIRMSSTADDDQADLFYGLTFTAEDRVPFTVNSDGAFHDYELAVPVLAPNARLRLDPTNGTGRIVIQRIEALGTPGPPDELRLDNGVIEIAMDVLVGGGAITWLSPAGDPRNLVNNFDRGRQIQISLYAGQSLDRTADGQNPSWSPWPWNPIQVGDSFGNPAEVLVAEIVDGVAHTRTIPKLWDMNNEPAEATFETWVTLHGNVAHVENRIEIFRTDNIWTQQIVRDQELPAIYTITQLPHLLTYLGESAWTRDELTTITRIVIPGAESFPWNHWPSAQYPGTMIERWAATVDDSGWGVGVFYKEAELYIGGQVGGDGGGEFSGSTKYISPLRRIAFGPTETFEFDYDLIIGTIDEIRDHVYARMTGYVWNFNRTGDAEGWTFLLDTAGHVVEDGALKFDVTGPDPILESPPIVLAGPLNRYVHLRLKNGTDGTAAQIFWSNEKGGPGAGRVKSFTISANDSTYRDYVIDMSGEAGWEGTLSSLRIDPVAGTARGPIEITAIMISDDPGKPFPADEATNAHDTWSLLQ